MAGVGKQQSPDPGALYLTHRSDLIRAAVYVLYRSGLADDAEDVVQRVFVKLLDNMPANITDWRAYLITLVRRQAIDFIREKVAADKRDRNDAGLAINTSTHAFDESTVRLDRDRTTTVRQAISALPEPHRTVIIARYEEESKGKAVAEKLGISPGRVSQIHAEALDQLRAALGGGAK